MIKKIVFTALLVCTLTSLQAQNIIWHTYKFDNNFGVEMPGTVKKTESTNAYANITNHIVHTNESFCEVIKGKVKKTTDGQSYLLDLPYNKEGLKTFYEEVIEYLEDTYEISNATVEYIESQSLSGAQVVAQSNGDLQYYEAKIFLIGDTFYALSYGSKGEANQQMKDRFFDTVSFIDPKNMNQTIGVENANSLPIAFYILIAATIAMGMYVLVKIKQKRRQR
ncbi:hypothetical protein [Neptunitalea lumnitzerae]|uniref:Uncharacterized protein n=1 Tax=Neptunitalea lumnitzerae TaxID=2965509 RepID=A0ABQ5MFR9_9FLAO|nr:hypothetical protein [Neptunitalea sp. Y10]GLB47870.1 hypothetical protein Y10_02380 [Neptunitalea sp. Y10]